MQGRAFEDTVKGALGIDFHETSADGAFTLEPVYCLGNCAAGPALMIDDRVFGRMNAARFAEVTERYRESGEAE